ncbi:MAG: class I SAM-dependent methyltransferase [Firmicutes bacterium]|nr:class I SAM-dependent methyltransferase [Bacillota bacterium]
MSNSVNTFEETYRRLRQQNKEGWNTEKISQSMFEMTTNILKRNNIYSGSLLDLGCGDGRLTLQFAQHGFEAYGIDISPTAISWAIDRSKIQLADAKFKVGSVLDLPYKSEKFDILIDSFCFHCIIGKDRKKFLSEAFRVLKNNGVLIIMTKCGNPKDSNYPFDPITRCKVENGVPTRYWGLPENIIAEVKDGGFNILDYEIFNYEQDLLVINAIKLL